MKVDLDSIRRRDPAALKELMRAVRKSARAGCVKIGAEHLADDVAQELFVLFTDRLIDRFDPAYNLEPYLIKAAGNVARVMLRQQKELPQAEGEEEDRLVVDEDEGPVLAHEQRAAMERVLKAFQDEHKPSATDECSAAKRSKREPYLSPEGRLLRQIRKDLSLTQREFAMRLGIPLPTLLAYEYGRARKVQKRVMEEALRMREFNAKAAPSFMAGTKRP